MHAYLRLMDASPNPRHVHAYCILTRHELTGVRHLPLVAAEHAGLGLGLGLGLG